MSGELSTFLLFHDLGNYSSNTNKFETTKQMSCKTFFLQPQKYAYDEYVVKEN